jgi:hypothetical protein
VGRRKPNSEKENEMSKLNYPMTVKAGALALDKIMPGWFRKIDVDMLDMNDCAKCIVGQLNGGISYGFSDFLNSHFECYDVRIYEDGAFGYRTSLNEWIAEIKQRLNRPLFRGPQLRVRVLRRHFNQAKEYGKGINYTDIFNCPIAQALKELFPDSRIVVGPDDLSINRVDYTLINGDCRTVEANKPFTCTIVKIVK